MPLMFKLNQTYRSVADVISRFSRWLPWWPPWISERNHFSNSKSPCNPNAFHQVSPPSDLPFGNRYQLKTYKIEEGAVVRRFSRRLTILAILNLYRSDISNQVLTQSDLWFGRRCRLKNFKMAAMRPSWISEWNDFSNSESLCHRDASHHVLAQSNLPFERRCHLKNFKIASMVAILDIGMEQLKQFSIFMLLQVLAQSHLRFGRRCCLKYLKMAAMAAILDMGTERFLQL